MPTTAGIAPDLLLPLAIIWIAPAVWVYLDVRRRGGRAVVWAVEWLLVSLVALVVARPLAWLPLNLLGMAAYLLLRPTAARSDR